MISSPEVIVGRRTSESACYSRSLVTYPVKAATAIEIDSFDVLGAVRVKSDMTALKSRSCIRFGFEVTNCLPSTRSGRSTLRSRLRFWLAR